MLYLDTHVIVWLYAGLIEKFSSNAVELIESNELFISPIIKLELTYLFETKRIKYNSEKITSYLQSSLDLKICDISFDNIINQANVLHWTRDPFDRLITANAICQKSFLLTKDSIIRQHYKLAVWD